MRCGVHFAASRGPSAQRRVEQRSGPPSRPPSRRPRHRSPLSRSAPTHPAPRQTRAARHRAPAPVASPRASSVPRARLSRARLARSPWICSPRPWGTPRSKINNDFLKNCVQAIFDGSNDRKRKFTESIELQVGLKNYDPQKDKRFAGQVRLNHVARPTMRICVLGDAYHCERAEQESVDFKTADGLKAFNKNKKLIKKFGAPPSPALAPRVARSGEGGDADLVGVCRARPASPRRAAPSPRAVHAAGRAAEAQNVREHGHRRARRLTLALPSAPRPRRRPPQPRSTTPSLRPSR